MPNDPMKYEVRNPEIEERLRGIAGAIGRELPAGYGFTLLLINYERSELFYISSAEREGIIRMMQEFIAKFRAN